MGLSLLMEKYLYNIIKTIKSITTLGVQLLNYVLRTT